MNNVIHVSYGVLATEDGKFVAFSQLEDEPRRYSEPYETRREASEHNERSYAQVQRLVAAHALCCVRRDVQ